MSSITIKKSIITFFTFITITITLANRNEMSKNNFSHNKLRKNFNNYAKNSASTFNNNYAKARLNVQESLRLYEHWVTNAYSGLIAALANQRLQHESKNVIQIFERCARNADSVPKHSKCLQDLIQQQNTLKNSKNAAKKVQNKNFNYSKYNTENISGNILKTRNYDIDKRNLTSRLLKYQEKKSNITKMNSSHIKKVDWLNGFRIATFQTQNNIMNSAISQKEKETIYFRKKRDITHQAKELPALLSPTRTPIGGVAKILTQFLLQQKGKTELLPWQKSIRRLQVLKEKHAKENFTVNAFDPSILKNSFDEHDHKAFLKRMPLTDAIQKFLPHNNGPKKLERLSALLQEGMKIGQRIIGSRPVRFASPRFLSILPEDDDGSADNENKIFGVNGNEINKSKNTTINIISPSLLSLHDVGHGLERELSIPGLMRSLGADERQAWINLIMEASGTNDRLEQLEAEANNTQVIENIQFNESDADSIRAINVERVLRDFRTKDGRALYFTKKNATALLGPKEGRKFDVYEAVIRSMTRDQWLEMNETGYSILNPLQIRNFYGPKSPYASKKALKRYARKSRHQLMRDMNADLKHISEAEQFRLRLHDIIQSPTLMAPIIRSPGILNNRILSPLAFSPFIQSPTIIGSMVLSPWIFSPLLFSPHLLMPLILSPYVFSPNILSPLVFQPNILSPGVFSPFILSPYLFTPSILSPYVFSPLILNPFVLSPVILAPTVGNPVILSPYVLSPILGSPQSLGGLFLSPYAASPVFLSQLSFFLAILSPSILS